MDRRIVLGAMFALLFAFTAFVNAEEPKKEKGGDKGRRGGPNFFALVEKLDLTADQKTQVAKIKADAEAAFKAAKEAKDREAGKKAFEDTREKLMAVLTDDQKEQLKKLLEENRPKGDRPPGDRPPKGDK